MLYCVHHLNDFSGSPLILRDRMDAMAAHGPVTLITNHGTGFLSTWYGPYIRFKYEKHENKFLRLWSLTMWYVRVGIFLIRTIESGDKLVISTLINSPLLLVHKFKRGIDSEIFVNEIYFRVPIWNAIGLRALHNKRVLKTYLSKFVREHWNFSDPCRVVYPKLRESLVSLAVDHEILTPPDIENLRFFLVCSQVEAKGYRLFIQIAEHFEREGAGHSFALFLSGNHARFASDYPPHSLPRNLSVVFNETSPEIFFGHDIFLGLTDPSGWVETFGQTFAEAMVAGNITIIPSVGAQLEYIEDGNNGFVFKEYSLQGIVNEIDRICSLPDLAALRARSRESMMNFLEINEAYQTAFA